MYFTKLSLSGILSFALFYDQRRKQVGKFLARYVLLHSRGQFVDEIFMNHDLASNRFPMKPIIWRNAYRESLIFTPAECLWKKMTSRFYDVFMCCLQTDVRDHLCGVVDHVGLTMIAFTVCTIKYTYKSILIWCPHKRSRRWTSEFLFSTASDEYFSFMQIRVKYFRKV